MDQNHVVAAAPKEKQKKTISFSFYLFSFPKTEERFDKKKYGFTVSVKPVFKGGCWSVQFTSNSILFRVLLDTNCIFLKFSIKAK